MLEFGPNEQIKVGIKQTSRAITEGKALSVYIAKDADPFMLAPLIELAEQCQIPVVLVDTMKELGRACKIDVGAATAVILK